ncbi:hypothetical protein BD310DRAFT_927970 [Dichomitus squalens]|uniref:F-box domain-containing protein n=1 Tax=Dichomitus squalens TaxID=114155 RepID=A0A4Q9PUR9_9APHY|nr:hypothetical protein BD310DRAFT_927970 [Dichomitus squalens]
MFSPYLGLETLSLTLFGQDISYTIEALRHVRSQELRQIAITHLCFDQSGEDTVSQWSKLSLDGSLATQAYRGLEMLHITLCAAEPYVENVDGRWDKSCKSLLPKCYKRGIVELSLEDVDDPE